MTGDLFLSAPSTQAIIRKRWPRTEVSASVLLVVAGCVVAGIGDLTFDLGGYVFALLSCTSQAAYLLLVEFQVTDVAEHGLFSVHPLNVETM